jgi:hypothetical protein
MLIDTDLIKAEMLDTLISADLIRIVGGEE